MTEEKRNGEERGEGRREERRGESRRQESAISTGIGNR